MFVSVIGGGTAVFHPDNVSITSVGVYLYKDGRDVCFIQLQDIISAGVKVVLSNEGCGK